MKSIEKLRESSHLDDNKWTLDNGNVVVCHGHEPSDPDAVNWGAQWRKIADEIEAEIAEKYMKLPVDADGVPIHLYDKLLKSTGATKPTYGEVVGISDDSVFFNAEQGWESNWSKLTRHVKPRTLEDVLLEFASKRIRIRCEHGEYSTSADNDVIAEYADRIRELMGGAE